MAVHEGEADGGDYWIGVDIGGTFTDLVAVAGEHRWVGKVLSTPTEPSKGVEDVLRDTLQQAGLPASAVTRIVHGTTLVTNALIERKGAKTALLTTEGFRDTLEIRREHRFELYDTALDLPKPLVPRHLRFDVPQRSLADGTRLRELDEERVRLITRELASADVEAVAICFLHSFTDPEPEIRARDLVLEEAPGMAVAISSEVAPEIREYERTSTVVANVYVQPLCDAYLADLLGRLEALGFEGSFFVMLSSGGIATAGVARRFPVRLLESGPAAGAIAAAGFGRTAGSPDLLSFDMGGTTAKLSVIVDGAPVVTHNFEADRVYRFQPGSGLPISTPVIDLIEIGAGGGSIAGVDALGLLSVGPASAGSRPGPACYGFGGTQPTVTDADLVLGYLDPSFFLGGEMRLDPDLAAAAIVRNVGEPLDLNALDAALGIYRLVNEHMVNAARVHVLERGRDTAGLPLFAFGGAGPIHAYQVARLLGSRRLVVPPRSGVTSALGFLMAPLAFDVSRSHYAALDAADWTVIADLIATIEDQGRALLTRSGVPEEHIAHSRTAEMRYTGQGREIAVPVPAGPIGPQTGPALRAAFEQEYRRLFGRLGPPAPIEVVTWRATSSGPRPNLLRRRGVGARRSSDIARKGLRRACLPDQGEMVEVPVLDRYLLEPGTAFSGPAIVEERESTTVVAGPAEVHVDALGCLVVELP